MVVHIDMMASVNLVMFMTKDYQSSDVTIIEIDIEIAIFRKIERNRYRDFLEQL